MVAQIREGLVRREVVWAIKQALVASGQTGSRLYAQPRRTRELIHPSENEVGVHDTTPTVKETPLTEHPM
jgi:hypothetical protein